MPLMGRSRVPWLLSKHVNTGWRQYSVTPKARGSRGAFKAALKSLLRPEPSRDQGDNSLELRPPKYPREKWLSEFNEAIRRVDASDQGHQWFLWLPKAYPPCVTPVGELTKTMIDDLRLNTHHRGTYLVVRSLTPQNSTSSISAIVEDEKGEVVMVQLWRQQTDDRDPLVDKGTVMVLKEPYLVKATDGKYLLRVDHVSDVVFLLNHDERMPAVWRAKVGSSDTTQTWRAHGDKHRDASQYRSAIKCYTLSLSCSPTLEEECMARLGRSQALHKSEQYDAALSDADIAVATGAAFRHLAEKARFRQAEALYALHRYQECYDVLAALCRNSPYHATAKGLLQRAAARVAEQTYGTYPFLDMQAEARKRQTPELDHATYIGPVRIQDAGPRGRGVFTTKPVKLGELLFCEKVFATSWGGESLGEGAKIEMEVDTDPAGASHLGKSVAAYYAIIRKMQAIPSCIPKVVDLYAGSYPCHVTNGLVDGQPIIDSFQIRHIVGLNSFSMCRSTHSNAFKTAAKDQVQIDAAGVWTFASHVNHSCAYNAHRTFIGDFIIFRAAQDLAADTEITTWYVLPSHISEVSQRNPFETWGFECGCAMCTEAKEIGSDVRTKRNALLTELSSMIQGQMDEVVRTTVSWDRVLRRVESGVRELEQTFAQSAVEVPRRWLANLLFDVVRMGWNRPIHQKVMTTHRAVQLLLWCLRSLGFVIEGGERGTLRVKRWGLLSVDGADAMSCWLSLRRAYQETAPELVTPAEEYARMAYLIHMGEDETFSTTIEGTKTSSAGPSRPPLSKTKSRPSRPPKPAAPSRWKRTMCTYTPAAHDTTQLYSSRRD
ncbi:TPR domain protein [Chaetomium sp. MPI-SDFR-AT-0129]|nr:TPR domain protein [Chaetomium sp. MPI-SDFR-AT-0129]